MIFTSKFIFGLHSCIFYLPWILKIVFQKNSILLYKTTVPMEEAKNAWKSDSYNSSSSVRVAPAEMVKTNQKDKTSLLLGYYEVVDRERLENDVNNVGVMAALLGGFALNSLDEKLGTFIYILAVIAVHACTCG